jgi:hypothetical protein
MHHVAFDAHLIGVDPDYRIHVSDRLLEIRDGPLKGIAGTLIDRPNRIENPPDRDRPGVSVRVNLRSPHSFDRTKTHAEERR